MKVSWVPTLFSTIILGFGIFSIFLLYHEHFPYADLFVILAACITILSGFFEKRFKHSTEFGKEYHSLAALITFGLAPSLMIHFHLLAASPISGLLLASLFSICAALQLARLNSTKKEGHSLGLPIHVAGSLLVILNEWSPHSRGLTISLIILLSGLMIRRITILPLRKHH